MLRWSVPQVLANYTGGKIMRIFPKVFKTAMEKAQLPLSEMARVAGSQPGKFGIGKRRATLLLTKPKKIRTTNLTFFPY